MKLEKSDNFRWNCALLKESKYKTIIFFILASAYDKDFLSLSNEVFLFIFISIDARLLFLTKKTSEFM